MTDFIDAQIWGFLGHTPSFFLHISNRFLTDSDFEVLQEIRLTYSNLEIRESSLLPIACNDKKEEIWAIFMNPPGMQTKCIMVKRPTIYELQLEFNIETCQ